MKAVKDIIIIGSGIEAWITAATLRMRMPSENYKIRIIEPADHECKINSTADFLARPSSIKLHHILQISESDLGQYAKARPALCAQIDRDGFEPILLPFGQYGIDRDGTEFQHFWKRNKDINADGDHIAPLADYNLAIAMHRASLFTPTAPAGLPRYDYGYILDEAGYIKLLQTRAANVQHICAAEINVTISKGSIKTIEMAQNDFQADLYIDATANKMLRTKIDDHNIAWAGNCVAIIGNYDDMDQQSGMRFHRLQSAIERLINLWPDKAFASCEIDEYNRLADEEQKHIADMNALLSSGRDAAKRSAALLRKISVFEARGRIAIEDYEIYSKAEWIAALSAANILPKSYDRMVLRVDESTAATWLSQLRHRIDSMISQGVKQRSHQASGQSSAAAN